MPIPNVTSYPAPAPPAIEPRTGTRESPERLQVAALVQQFEGMLLSEMLRDMRPAEEDDGEAFGLGGSTMADAMNTEFGLALSKAGGLGLADTLAASFARQQGLSPALVAPITEGKATAPVREEAPATPAEVTLTLPAATVTSDFGWRHDPFTGQAKFHAGTDLRMAYGEVVKAPGAGTVSFAGEKAGYGLTVVVDHGDGRETLLAHLSGVDVKPGDLVTAEQPIARSGNSGRATGPHLHVEVREFGRPVDPRLAALPAADTSTAASGSTGSR